MPARRRRRRGRVMMVSSRRRRRGRKAGVMTRRRHGAIVMTRLRTVPARRRTCQKIIDSLSRKVPEKGLQALLPCLSGIRHN